MRGRAWTLIAFLLVVAIYLQFLSDVQAVPLRQPLSGVPLAVGEWIGRPQTMTDSIVQAVGVHDYLLRDYRNPGGQSVSAYVGYYKLQREGAQAHSPKHCLPGSGWTPLRSDQVAFPTPGFNGGVTRANRHVIGKGTEKELVLFWYQGRGRDTTNEYLNKLYLVIDSIFRKRTDGALVRLIAPLPDGAPVEPVQERMIQFARVFLPDLGKFLPE